MKRYFIWMIFHFSLISITISQEEFAVIGNNLFLVGTKANLNFQNYNNYFNDFKLANGKIYFNDHYQAGTPIVFNLQKVNGNSYYLSFDIPNFKSLVGSKKELLFVKTTPNGDSIITTSINIYSAAPILESYRVLTWNENYINRTYQEIQTIEFDFKNLIHVDTFGTFDDGIAIQGYDIKSDTLLLHFYTKDVRVLRFYFTYYSKKSNAEKLDTVKIELDRITLRDEISSIPFRVTSDSILYLDDIKAGLRDTLNFIFDTPLKNGLHEIRIKNPITGVMSPDIDFEKSNIQLSANETMYRMPLKTASRSGKFKIELKPVVNYVNIEYVGNLEILPVPKIDEVEYNSLNSNFIYFVRKKGETYYLKLKGEELHKMDDLTAVLINVKTGYEIELTERGNEEINIRRYEVKFDNVSSIDTGNYKILLRKMNNITPIDYVCQFVNFIIKEPLEVCDSAKYVKIVNPKYIYKEEKNTKLLNNSQENRQYVLTSTSPFKLRFGISDSLKLKYGSQYIDVLLSYYKNDGNVETRNINGYLINKTEQVEDLRDIFGIQDLRINESIQVSIKHSSTTYKSLTSNTSMKYQLHRGLEAQEKVGLTVSLPPYLGAFRNVRRKNITTDENGNITDVKYDGSYKLEYQSLVLNAGIGIKYRNMSYKSGKYEPQRMALGLYFMGVDMAENQSTQEQEMEEDNYNFIGRGSFNILLLGEYSLLDLQNVNSRIPVYFGCIVSPNPVDQGKKAAFCLGLGIDLSIAGNK